MIGILGLPSLAVSARCKSYLPKRAYLMSIKVELSPSDKQFPIHLSLNGKVVSRLTKKAAIELEKKLHASGNELMEKELELKECSK